ncbi:hypothetical protein ACFYKX_04060 [Cytobacillus sp. FJAT-54145]|uniref:Uncharacterized protein n=1 Tax=Cytobacillus spartinae TaxID=3299023 RepID=A0ABW6KA28_9BACI
MDVQKSIRDFNINNFIELIILEKNERYSITIKDYVLLSRIKEFILLSSNQTKPMRNVKSIDLLGYYIFITQNEEAFIINYYKNNLCLYGNELFFHDRRYVMDVIINGG